MVKQLAFYDDIQQIFDQEELEDFLLDKSEFYKIYAEEYWLSQYHELKRKSLTTHVPSITSFLSDSPSSPTNQNNSKTEDYALKSVDAGEKLDIFDKCLERLPEEFQELIRKKYLQRRSDGKLYEDAYVYDTLSLSRTQYYRVKKQALFEFGEMLYTAHYTHYVT